MILTKGDYLHERRHTFWFANEANKKDDGENRKIGSTKLKYQISHVRDSQLQQHQRTGEMVYFFLSIRRWLLLRRFWLLPELFHRSLFRKLLPDRLLLLLFRMGFPPRGPLLKLLVLRS